MNPGCELEVDVNGEEVFLANKKFLCSYSHKRRNLLSHPAAAAPPPRLILRHLPGGAAAFELLTRFCYNHCSITVPPSISSNLRSSCIFMERNDNSSPPPPPSSSPSSYSSSSSSSENHGTITMTPSVPCTLHFSATFMEKTKKISSSPSLSSSSSTSSSSPSPSSSSSSSSEKIHEGIPLWIEDPTISHHFTAETFINHMISHKTNHSTITKFLLHHLKSKQNSPLEEKKKTVETAVDFIFFLELPLTCKTLFGIHHFSAGLKVTKSCRIKLEKMIGEKLENASLDSLLVSGEGGIYDVDLVLRLVRVFVSGRASPERMTRVAALVDSYMEEIAPEKGLKREKFVGVLRALPDEARESYDRVYRAVDVFLQVHAGAIKDEERERVCAAVNYRKLSPEACSHLAGNSRFPPRATVRAIAAGQSKIKTLLRAAEEREQIVIYARKMEVFPAKEAEKVRAHLRGMQWKVAELEKVCRKMRSQMRKMAAVGGRRTLPRLCS